MCKYVLNCPVLVSLVSQEWRRGNASLKKKVGVWTDTKTEEHNKIVTTNDIEKRNLEPGPSMVIWGKLSKGWIKLFSACFSLLSGSKKKEQRKLGGGRDILPVNKVLWNPKFCLFFPLLPPFTPSHALNLTASARQLKPTMVNWLPKVFVLPSLRVLRWREGTGFSGADHGCSLLLEKCAIWT